MQLSKLSEPLKYFIVGGLATCIDRGIMYFLLGHGVSYVICIVISFSIGFIVNYLLCYLWVFRSSGTHRTLFTKTICVGILGIMISISLMVFFVEILGNDPFYARVFATIITFIRNYLGRKHYVFKI